MGARIEIRLRIVLAMLVLGAALLPIASVSADNVPTFQLMIEMPAGYKASSVDVYGVNQYHSFTQWHWTAQSTNDYRRSINIPNWWWSANDTTSVYATIRRGASTYGSMRVGCNFWGYRGDWNTRYVTVYLKTDNTCIVKNGLYL